MRPPYSNRGVTIGTDGPEGGHSDGNSPAFFDAYCASAYAHPSLVLDHLEQALEDGGFRPTREDGPPVKCYAANTLLVDYCGQRLLSVRHGGQNHHPFVEAKGAVSATVAECLRRHFDHAPSRIDSAIDLTSPTVFAELHAIAKQFEAQGRLLDYAGAAADNPDRGTTIYLGSRHSQSFVRIYQKGLKIAAEMGLSGDEIPDELRNWVRVELEFKPDKRPARLKSTKLSPDALWGCSPWTRQFATAALSIEAERVKISERRESNHDRALRYMFEHYGKTMDRQAELLGSWEAFGRYCQARRAQLEQAA